MQIDLDEEEKTATVLIPNDELSLAIGKGGQNVRLTAKLTEWNIDVTSPEELASEEGSGTFSATAPSEDEEPEATEAPEAIEE